MSARKRGAPTGNVRVRGPSALVERPEPSLNRRRQQPVAAGSSVDLRATGPVDGVLAGALVAMVGFGEVMVYSASAVWAQHRYHDAQKPLLHQIIFGAIGLCAAFGLGAMPYHWLRSITYPFAALAFGLLLATVVGFGHSAGGAARWLDLRVFYVQPAELIKVAVILWLAHSLAKKSASVRSLMLGVVPHVLGCAVVIWVCLKQPDFGSAVMVGLIAFFMLFTAGARLSHLFAIGLLTLPLGYWLVAGTEYRMRRIAAFLAQGDNYQLKESQMCFGAGGIGGVGIGDSRQKLLYLPEAHTDFISAIVAEELGLIGFSVLCAVFLLVLYRGIRVALHAADDYGTYLAVGITLFIATQAFTNLAVAVGVLPTKGLVLPFISYGGSSLLVNCCAFGVLLNVSRPRGAAGSNAKARAGALSLGGVT
jgi:cell division protein FtsW